MANERKTVAVLYGGKSTEHEISLLTAFSVINAINLKRYRVLPVYINQDGRWIPGSEITGKLESKDQLLLHENSKAEHAVEHWIAPSSPVDATSARPDIVFPLLHGPNGEDGTVQGLMELLNLAYVGSGVAGSSVCMDKVLMKDILKTHKIQGPNYLSVSRFEWESDAPSLILAIKRSIGYPCFVKPANGGSSVGISKCVSETDLSAAITEALLYDSKVIVEEHINGREIEIGVLGNHELSISVPGEIITKNAAFYDYQSKYHEGNSTLVIPVHLSEKVLAELEETAKRAFAALNLSGLARVDVFLREKDQRIVVNELNTMPGFTQFSMFPLLWQHTGLSYPQLIETLIDLGLQRHDDKQKIHYRIQC
ncbi:D-alanine--D-alanine ligase [Sporolactobacillus terrae]|uniref:D-alanine--D-alanine ligase n=1 Tax=Sporolactobacillus terrae TaxID=269673 RepID=A0ABX5Q665_9BACL|nr:D-alanine--D-alanine ligase [Sporolactobacillus terrae]QAA22118.1 D-alanine--D-alanine ligase [Sporolactobacillus terrae]QAA25090.1 D-alanine--D-alanine ligase [Sporolactobacillus terrae]UAK16912.1 D-alanine--D-alanine ligase [Sporolactobacillus terrae]